MTKKYLLYTIVLFLMYVMISCSSVTYINNEWHDANYKSSDSEKIAVSFIDGNNNESDMKVFRDMLINEINSSGIYSQSTNLLEKTYFNFEKGGKNLIPDSILTELKSKSYNLLVIIKYSNLCFMRVIKGNFEFNRIKFTGSWNYSFYETHFGFANSLASYYRLFPMDDYLFLNTYLIDIDSNKLISIIHSNTVNFNNYFSIQELAESYSKKIIEQIQINHLINN